MSCQWANDLVYRMTGSEAPKQGNGGGRGGNARDTAGNAAMIPLAGIDALWDRATSQTPDWKIITMRTPSSPRPPVQFQIDLGEGGRPDLRTQLTLNRKTAEQVRLETFASYNAGRQLRSWIRFTHTGEAGGVAGETIAALASLGAVFLACTGISLAIRRLSRVIALRKAEERELQAVA